MSCQRYQESTGKSHRRISAPIYPTGWSILQKAAIAEEPTEILAAMASADKTLDRPVIGPQNESKQAADDLSK